MAAIALEIKHRVDHVLDQLGPGDLAILGDVPDQHDGAAAHLGKAHQRVGRRAHLGNGAGGSLQPLDPERLDRIDDDEIRGRTVVERRQDVGKIAVAGQRQGRVRHAETLGPEPHLRGGLFPEK